MRRPPLGGLLLLLLAGLFATAALAQDDGPRVYQLAPVGAKTFTAFAVVKRGDETPEGGDVIPGSKIATNMLVLRYAQTFDLAGRQFNPFFILPMGQSSSTVYGPAGGVTNGSGGFGDVQLGAVLGLFGAPALTPEAYAGFRTPLSTGLLARVFFPTGAYERNKPVNLGAGRYSYQLGLPTTLLFGQSYRSPTLTALEVLPTVTFYAANTQPYGAQRVSKAPLFSVESHLTRTLTPSAWISADMLYRSGGATSTDGYDDDNPTRGWSAGLSGAYRLLPMATVILTWEHVVQRSDDGPNGWFFRTAVVVPLQ
jgi:hypothetical protein